MTSILTPRRRVSHGPQTGPALPWITVERGRPYFVDEHGRPWTPVGQNEAITWPELSGLFQRRDLDGAQASLARMRDAGVNCIRLMLEYGQREHRYLERPVGRFVPAMVRLWDDLFALCVRLGIRVLLTPFDTFFLWRRWNRHPYSSGNGGPCAARTRLASCRVTRLAIKERLSFAIERWGGSGVIAGWDLWNELHPAHAEADRRALEDFVADVASHVRQRERELYGRSRPLTVSLFGPELQSSPWLAELLFRHPELDFATAHLYEHGTIDHPRDTVAPAVSMGRLVRECIQEINDGRPFLDSEHGPIHSFKDRHRTLPEAFDDEYFRHLQWAHLASGGAGGGMRWPYRHPHTLTDGMRHAQRSLVGFLPLIDWNAFERSPALLDVQAREGVVATFASRSRDQLLAWLLRTDALDAGGRVNRAAAETSACVRLAGMPPGRYRVTAFDTLDARIIGRRELHPSGDGILELRDLRFAGDVALAIRPG